MLTFFDIPSSLHRAWSPNTWKVRFYLNYHSIPYRTQWVELPAIESTCVSLGIPPSKVQPPSPTHPDGRKTYTVPAIHDPATGTYVSESGRIMRYLDGRYPSTRASPAFPQGSSVLQAAFLSAWTSKVIVPLWTVITPDVAKKLNPESQGYFEETRKAVFQGRTMEELDADEAGKRASWERVRRGLSDVGRWFEKSDLESLSGQDKRQDGGGGTERSVFVMGGDSPVFSDFVMPATFAYMRNVWGEDHERWKEVATWDGGRWARFVDTPQVSYAAQHLHALDNPCSPSYATKAAEV